MVLFSLPRPDVILLQLPPAVPTMLVCRLAAARHRARLVFDWHNFAYTLMAINMGGRHPLVSQRAASTRGVGLLEGRGGRPVPVSWRDGTLSRPGVSVGG